MQNASATRRYTKEEIAGLGDSAYASKVRLGLSEGDAGKFAAIDVATDAYELAESEVEACDRLRARVPQAQIWLVRVGSPYVHRFGGRPRVGFSVRRFEAARFAE